MRAAVLLSLLVAGCDPGCRAPPAAPLATDVPAPQREVPARCVEEVRAASVVFPPGSGDVDALSVACHDGALGVFALRGHVLSWTSRNDRAGEGFSPPLVVGTGADRLGPVAHDAPQGPVAWRSPVADLDTPQRDDVWAGLVQRGDGGFAALRGDALLPEGTLGLGVPFVRVNPAGLFAVATVARQGVEPGSVSLRIFPGREESAPVALPLVTAPGHIEAWEPRTDTVLARVQREGASWLEARRGEVVLSRVRVRSPEMVVVSRGESTPAGAVFAVGEFAVGRGDGGACVGQPGGICVRPGRVTLLVVPPQGAMRELEVAPEGVPDALAWDGDAITVLYVEPGPEESTAQRAARIDVRSGARDRVALSPPEGFPPIDLPRLARCGDDLWMVAAVSVDERGARRVGVTALPLACVLR